MSLFVPVLILFVMMFLASAIKILNEYERGLFSGSGASSAAKGLA